MHNWLDCGVDAIHREQADGFHVFNILACSKDGLK
jgi:hypothetical protein